MNQYHTFWNSFFIDHKKVGFSVLFLCILTISIIYYSFSIGKPAMGTILSKDAQGWKVESVETNGLVEQAGIQEGDTPVEINGQPAQLFLGKYQKDGVVFGHLITNLTVIDIDGHLKSVSKYDGPVSWGFIISITLWIIVCLIWWISGLYAFFKSPNNLATLLFCLCGFAFGLALSANSAAVRAVPNAIYLEVLGTVISPWLLLHFFVVLPEEQQKLKNNPYVYLLYLPAVITLILYPLIGYSNGQSLPEFRTIRIFGYGIGLIAAAGVAVFNYLFYRSVRTHQQMKIVLIGCLAALVPFSLLSIIPAAVFGMPISDFSVLFFALIPLAMGYAIVTKKLMDIDVIIRRGVIYGVITFVLASIMSVAVFLIWNFRESFRVPEQILISIVLSGIATLLFGPVRRGVGLLLDKFIYKDRYDYRQIIHNLGISLNSVSDSTGISRLIVGTIVNTLNLAGGCLLVNKQSSLLIRSAQGTFTEITNQKKLIELASQRKPEIEFPNRASKEFPGLAYIIPLVTADKEVGILCLSEKTSRQVFVSDDLFLIDGFASVAAIKLYSAMLIQDVSIRDTFVSVASHELRTPLTTIVGYADLLLQRNPPEDTKKQWIKKIFDSGTRLSTMVDDLLNVSRIHSGKVTINLEKVRLSDVLNESVPSAAEIIDKHEFVTKIQPELPIVLIDKDKLRQVVINLLDNAIKYSPKGGRIILSACYEPEKYQVVISISDEGIGISQSDMNSLFTTFHRIQRPETQGIRGSGLGLYIAKEWTEAMGGRIWVESELNKGSTFFVAIPISSDVNIMDKSCSLSA